MVDYNENDYGYGANNKFGYDYGGETPFAASVTFSPPGFAKAGGTKIDISVVFNDNASPNKKAKANFPPGWTNLTAQTTSGGPVGYTDDTYVNRVGDRDIIFSGETPSPSTAAEETIVVTIDADGEDPVEYTITIPMDDATDMVGTFVADQTLYTGGETITFTAQIVPDGRVDNPTVSVDSFVDEYSTDGGSNWDPYTPGTAIAYTDPSYDTEEILFRGDVPGTPAASYDVVATFDSDQTAPATATETLTKQNEFITTWNVASNGETLTLPLTVAGTYSGTIDWGDGNTSSLSYANRSHVYATAGVYTIKISGTCTGWVFANGSGGAAPGKILTVEHWGDSVLTLNEPQAFWGCVNLDCVNAIGNGSAVLTGDMNDCFRSCTSLTGGLAALDVSGMTIAQQFFEGATAFNEDISGWDMSSCTNTFWMFFGANSFNQDISGWDLSNVTTATGMFQGASSFNNGGASMANMNWSSCLSFNQFMYNASAFNQNVSGWTFHASGPIDGYRMFSGATPFNQDLSSWDMSKFDDLRQFLISCSSFNNGGASWANADFSSATQMNEFVRNTSFNQSVANWTFGSLSSCNLMFAGTPFNQDVTGWTFSGADGSSSFRQMFQGANSFNNGGVSMASFPANKSNNMGFMFYGVSAFNVAVNGWDVSNVTAMDEMFRGANSFNQDISSWVPSSVTTTLRMFRDATSFNNGGSSMASMNWSSCTTFSNMFENANAFNQSVANWTLPASSTNMSSMFLNCSNFNQPLTGWTTTNVTNTSSMFQNADAFNQDMSGLDFSGVTNAANMFYGMAAFNNGGASMANMDWSSCTNMNNMFYDSDVFNQSLANWNVSSCTSFVGMFQRMTLFNQDISSWTMNTTSNWNATGMFAYSTAFDQSLASWDVSRMSNATSMFLNVTLSTATYDALLNGWAAQTLQSGVTFHGGNSQYTVTGQTGRNTLTGTYGWSITDGGLV